MGLFKNKVGRPSNETIRKRRTVYVLIFLAIVLLGTAGTYYTSEYFSNNKIDGGRKNATTKTTTVAKSGDVASEIILGGDGKITREDAEIIKRLIAGETINGKTKDTLYKGTAKNKLADINGDGEVDDKDLELVSYFMFDVKSAFNYSISEVNQGDINKNGEYDYEDLAILGRYVHGHIYSVYNITQIQKKLGDLNKDGYVDKKDIAILGYLLLEHGTCKKDSNNKNEKAKNAIVGDVNCDGLLDSKDIDLISKYSDGKIKPNSIQKKQADTDGNGSIGKEDSTLLKSILNTGSTYVIGDINKDGKRNLKDLTRLNKYINGETTLDAVQLDLADVDRDGKVTKTDLTILQRITSGYGDVANAYKSQGDGKLTWEDYEFILDNKGEKASTLISSNLLSSLYNRQDSITSVLTSFVGTASSTQRKAADIDGNGIIDETDAEEMLNMMNNKFSGSTKTINGVKISYDKATQVITLNGKATSSIGLSKLINQQFRAGEKYKITLTYVSGTVTKNGSSAFATEIRKNDGTSVSTKNLVYVNYPTSTNKISKNVLTINSSSESKGSQLFTLLVKSGDIKFSNYKIKVNIVNTSRLSVVFYPNGSTGERKIITCNRLSNNSCTIKTPSISPKNGFSVIGWNSKANAITSEVNTSKNLNINKNRVYYAITKYYDSRYDWGDDVFRYNRRTSFFGNGKNVYYAASKETYDLVLKCGYDSTGMEICKAACRLYNGATSCTAKTPNIRGLNSGETLVGWSTIPDSITADVGADTEFDITSNIGIYYPVIRKEITVKFDKNDTKSLSFTEAKCYSYNGEGCYVPVPKITPSKGYSAVGFAATTSAVTPISTSEPIFVTNDSTYYAIQGKKGTKKTITVTFNKGNAKRISFDKATCVSYDGKGCKIDKVPTIYSKGNEVKGFAEASNKTKAISAISKIFYEDATLYAYVSNSSSRGQYNTIRGKYNIYREEEILGNPIYFEGVKDKDGSVIASKEDASGKDVCVSVPDGVASKYYEFLVKVSSNAPYLFLSKSPINYVVRDGRILQELSYAGIGYDLDNIEYTNIDVVAGCSNVYSQYYAETAIHELGHATDDYYGARTGKRISLQDDIKALFKLYKEMLPFKRPMRDYSYTKFEEFVADMFVYYYYYKYKPEGKNIPPGHGGNPINVEMAKVLEKYINELKQWV